MSAHQRAFEPLPTSVGDARRFVTDALRACGHEGLVEWAALVTSELATNAVLHAGTPFDVRVDANGDVIISVIDHSPDAPAPRALDTGATGGRGLLMVERSSRAWGVERDGTAKRVWCTSPRPGP